MIVPMNGGLFAVIFRGQLRFYPSYERAANILRTLRTLAAGPRPH